MCSRRCDKPAPSHFPSWMLPVRTHACTLATGAEWSSSTMISNPFRSVKLTADGCGEDRSGTLRMDVRNFDRPGTAGIQLPTPDAQLPTPNELGEDRPGVREP